MSTPERLIESTRDLLWERGYVGTSPKAILERAGAGQGSMYHHFKGKPDLALAAIRRTAEQLRAALCERGDKWALALEAGNLLVAVNQTLVPLDTPLNDGDEVAFFPPVTGG